MDIAYSLKSYHSVNDSILLKLNDKGNFTIFNTEFSKEKVLKYLEKELKKEVYEEILYKLKLKKDIYLVTNKYETRNFIRKIS
jgi:hypothetical protein